jgi:hypothetical protein
VQDVAEKQATAASDASDGAWLLGGSDGSVGTQELPDGVSTSAWSDPEASAHPTAAQEEAVGQATDSSDPPRFADAGNGGLVAFHEMPEPVTSRGWSGPPLLSLPTATHDVVP